MQKTPFVTLALLITVVIGSAQKPELVAYQEGHPSEPLQVCISKDGRLALSGSKERIVLWDLDAGKYIRHIDTDVQHFSFSADERNVLVVSNDSLLQAWSLASGKSLWATGLQKDIKTLTMQWSPDRRSLVTYNSAGLVSVWNLETGQRRWEKKWKPGGSLIEFSGSGNAFALRSAKGALLGGFKCDTGEEDNTFSTKLPLESKKLAVISSSKSIYRSETQITFFDLQHQVTKSLPELTTRFELFKSEDQPDLLLVSASNYNCFVSDFSFSPDGSKLAIAMGTHTAFFGSAPGLPLKRTGHGEIVIWDTKGDSLLQHLDSLPELITTLTFSNSGNELLSGCYNADVQYWNVDSKKELFLLRRKPTMEHGFSFSYDFRQLAMNKFDASFRTWNLSQRTGVNYREPSYYISPYYSARDFDKFALNNSGKQMITCGREGSIHLWKTAPLEHLGKLEDRHSCLEVANAIAISPDSKKALVFSADESRVLTFRQILYPIEEVQSFITNAANDTVGIVLQQGEMYGAVRVDAGKVEHIGGDTIENKIVRIFPSYSNFSLWDLEKKQSERVFYQDELEGDEDDFWVGFSPDVKFALASCRGKMIAWNIQSGARMKNENQDNTFHAMALNTPALVATIGPDSVSIITWQLADGKIRRRIQCNDGIQSIALHQNGKVICALTQNGELKEWSLETNALKRTVKGATPAGFVTYTPDSNFIVLHDNGTLNIWDLNAGKSRLKLGYEFRGEGLFYDGHRAGQVCRFDFLPSGNQLLVAYYDGTIECWNYKKGELLGTFFTLNEHDWIVTTPAGLFDASPGAMHEMYYRVGTEIVELDQLKERYFEPWLLQKLLGFSNASIRDPDGFGALDLYPDLRARILQGKLEVKLAPRAGGIGKVALFLNGKEVAQDINPDRADTLSIQLAQFEHYFIPDTMNTIGLRAYNSGGWLKSREHQWTFKAPRGRGGGSTGDTPTLGSSKPNLFALSIGTSNYSAENMKLQFADKDAAAIAEAVHSAGSALFNESRVHVKLLSTAGQGEVSNKTNIKAAFEEIAQQAKPTDVVFVYFSGHGITYGEAENSRFYYLTKDIVSEDLKDPAVRDNFTISSDELSTWLTKIPALKQVMVLDACNSGKVIDAFKNVGSKDLSAPQIVALERMKDRTGMFILTGSAADKKSFEASQFGQGLLTYSLLQGMSGMALTEDRRMDVMRLFQFSRDKVPELAREINGIQTPMLAFPDKGSSFDLGIVTDKVKIPLSNAKPVFIRPSFQETFTFDDPLNLNQVFADHLFELSTSAGGGAIVFIDVNSYENAYSFKGRYQLEGKTVKVQGRVYRGNELFKEFNKTATESDLKGLVEALMEEMFE